MCQKRADRRERLQIEEKEQIKAASLGEQKRNIKLYPFFGYTAVREDKV